MVHKRKIRSTEGKVQYVYTLNNGYGKSLRAYLSDTEVEDVDSIDWEPISDLILNLLSTSIIEEEEVTEVSEESLADDVQEDVDTSSDDGGSSDGGDSSDGDSGGGDGGGGD